MDKKIDYAKIYSPSKLGMFTQCPKLFHFYYLDPVYSQTKYELKRLPHNIWSFHTLGKAVHNAITLFYYLLPRQRTEKGLLEQLKETWISEVQWNKKPPLGKWGGFKTTEEERNSYRQAILMLKNFIKIAEIEPEIEYLPTKNFKRSISDYTDLVTPLDENFDISGKFDLIARDNDDSLHIVDFKTGKKEDEDHFQLRFYKLLAEEKFKKPVRKASFYFLKTGNKKEFDLEKEKKEKIREEILGKINQIKKIEDFKTRPSKLCQFCLFKTFCPEKEKVKDVKEEEYSDDLPF